MSKLIKRYRKENQNKATKPFTPVFSIKPHDVLLDLIGGRR